jgi:hypothetical protein
MKGTNWESHPSPAEQAAVVGLRVAIGLSIEIRTSATGGLQQAEQSAKAMTPTLTKGEQQ